MTSLEVLTRFHAAPSGATKCFIPLFKTYTAILPMFTPVNIFWYVKQVEFPFNFFSWVTRTFSGYRWKMEPAGEEEREKEGGKWLRLCLKSHTSVLQRHTQWVCTAYYVLNERLSMPVPADCSQCSQYPRMHFAPAGVIAEILNAKKRWHFWRRTVNILLS